MSLLENYVTLEEANSVLMINPNFNQIYKINCGLLPQSDFNDYYYDFNILSMITEEDEEEETFYHYVLKVYNKLWDGGVSFERIPSGSDEPTFYTDNQKNYNDEYYIIHILTTYTDFDILLSLNNTNDSPREYYPEPVEPPKNLTIDLDSTKLSYYYYETKSQTVTVKNSKGELVNGVSVTVNNSEVVGVTNSNGVFKFNIPSKKPSTYKYTVTVSKEDYIPFTTTFTTTVKKEKPTINYTDNTGHWGGYVTDSISLGLKGTITATFKATVTNENNKLNTNKTITLSKKNNVYTGNYEQSYRTLRINSTSIKISVPATAYTEAVTKTVTKSLTPKAVTSWANLVSEINNTKGVDYLRIPVGKIKVGTRVKVKRFMEIVGDKSTSGWASFNSGTNYCFDIESQDKKNVHLILKNLKFKDNKKVIWCNAYSNLEVINCYFVHNIAKNNIGSCIDMKTTDAYREKNYGTVKLSHCNLYNNKGSAVATSMNTSINNCWFILNNWDYAQHPQCWAVEIYGQKTNIKTGRFLLDMGNTRCPLPHYQHSNFSHGKAVFRIHPNAYLNNVKGSSMKKDNSLPVHGSNHYIYAKYEYDYVNCVASPDRGHEKEACSHVIQGTNWAYKNHMQVSSSYNNTQNKVTVHIPHNAIENEKLVP